jgi:hypothetical protein
MCVGCDFEFLAVDENIYKNNRKFINLAIGEIVYKKYKRFINEDEGQAGAEMLLLIGGMMVIVLIAIYFYNDYLSRIGNEISSTELNKLNDSIKNLSLKFS